jgi:hypothetical protein
MSGVLTERQMFVLDFVRARESADGVIPVTAEHEADVDALERIGCLRIEIVDTPEKRWHRSRLTDFGRFVLKRARSGNFNIPFEVTGG